MSSSELMYLRNYRQDLEFWMQNEEVNSINYITSGTPSFGTMEEARTYLDEVEKTIEALKENEDE